MRKSAIGIYGVIPIEVHASGGDILTLFWLELALLFAVVLSVAIGRLSWKGRFQVFGAYAVGVLSSWLLTEMLPYSDNIAIINTVCIGAPLILWLSVYIFVRKRYAKT